MKASLEIRKSKEDWWYSIYFAKNEYGRPVDTRDNYGAMAEQGIAIMLGWASPVEVE